jgi:uncharacterized protein YndB with AHSA1/START domain
MQDAIKREVIIKATKEEVYEAIANPEKVVTWFPDAVEGTYQAGEHSVFVFDHGKETLYVVDAKPHEYFSYRWVPGGSGFMGDVNTVAHTLVEFRIEEKGDECVVTVSESGFASLPADMGEKSFTENSGGWEFMLGRLEKSFEQK